MDNNSPAKLSIVFEQPIWNLRDHVECRCIVQVIRQPSFN